jgi:adenosylhomocysteine nucleosidase
VVLSAESKVAIVAALEREVRPFIKGWSSIENKFDGRRFKFFENAGTVLICGGIGAEAARRAAKAVISLYRPGLIISAGFAGALEPGLEVGHTLILRHVIDAADGSRTDTGVGEGVLLTFADVADIDQKARFREAYEAQAVDMEAAAVARSAEANGVRFMACKVISDTNASSLPPIARFVGSHGKFHVIKFVAYIAIRPWLWLKVQRLARDSEIASGKLCEALKRVRQAYVEERLPMVAR